MRPRNEEPRAAWVSDPPSWVLALAVAACLAALVPLARTLAVSGPTRFDDAFAFLRYADNILGGWGPAWNRGQGPVYGVTSVLWLGVVTAVRALLPSVGDGALLTGLSAGLSLLGLVALAWATRKAWGLFRPPPHMLLVLACVSVPLLLAGPYRLNALTGMDTMLGFAANALFVGVALAWATRPSRWTLAAVLGAAWLAFLARPENGLGAVVFVPLARWFLGSPGKRARDVAIYLGLFAAVLALDTVMKIAVFGGPLPLAFYAKQHGAYGDYLGAWKWNPYRYTLSFLRMVLPFLAAGALLWSRRSWMYFLLFASPAIAAVLYLFSVLQVMGMEARYYVPFAPFVIAGSAAAASHALEERAHMVQGRRGVRWINLLVAGALVGLIVSRRATHAAIVAYGAVRRPPPAMPARLDTTVVDLPALGWWTSLEGMSDLIRRLPAGTVVSLTEYGLVGALAPQVTILDPLGLHDPRVARNGFDAGRLLARKPVLIWMPHPDYAAIVRKILAEPEFWTDYEFYPGAFDYGLALRRTQAGPGTPVYRLVAAEWAKAYPGESMEAFRAARP